MLNHRSIILILICLATAPAHAQTLSSTRRAFVDVTAGPDWDDAYSASNRVPGTTLKSGFAFGFDWGRSGLEFDLGLSQWHVKHHEPYRYVYAGTSFGWQLQDHSYEHSSTVRRRSIEMAVLYRANVPLNRHVAFSWLAGGGYVYRPEDATAVTHEVRPDGQRTEVNVSKDTSSWNYPAAIARVDVELRVAPRVSVVPRLRVTAFPAFLDDSGRAPRLLIAQPEVAVRWQF